MRETQESSNPIRPRKSESCDGGLKGIEEEKLEKKDRNRKERMKRRRKRKKKRGKKRKQKEGE